MTLYRKARRSLSHRARPSSCAHPATDGPYGSCQKWWLIHSPYTGNPRPKALQSARVSGRGWGGQWAKQWGCAWLEPRWGRGSASVVCHGGGEKQSNRAAPREWVGTIFPPRHKHSSRSSMHSLTWEGTMVIINASLSCTRRTALLLVSAMYSQRQTRP